MTCSVGRRTVRSSGDVRQLKVTRPLSRSIMGRSASSSVFRVPVRAWTIWPPQYIDSATSLPLTAMSPDFFPSTSGFTRLNNLFPKDLEIKSLNTGRLLSRCEPGLVGGNADPPRDSEFVYLIVLT